MLDGHCIARHLASLSIEVGKFIESTGYTPGSAGWRIDGDGNLEVNDGIFRGTVTAEAVVSATTFDTNLINVDGNNLIIDTSGVVSFLRATSRDLHITGDTGLLLDTLSGTGNRDVTVIGDSINLQARSGGAVNVGTIGQIGFFGGGPASQQQILGSKGANAALANLLTALGNLGLIIDATT